MYEVRALLTISSLFVINHVGQVVFDLVRALVPSHKHVGFFAYIGRDLKREIG